MSTLSTTTTLAHRGLLKVRHDPQRLFDVVALPVVATVMFAGIFGGAVAGDVDGYLPRLVPGVMAQVAITASIVTGVQLRDDIETGVLDRFRSLPIPRIAPLAGSLVADVLRYVIASSIALLTGLALGYRPASALGAIGGVALIAVCAFAISWAFAFLGMKLSSAAAVQGISTLVLMPLTFLSNVLVPVDSMPGWMRPIATVNPVSHLVTAVRGLCDGHVGVEIGWSLLGAGVILLVLVPVTVRAFRTAT